MWFNGGVPLRITLALSFCSSFLSILQGQDDKPVFPAAGWERIERPEDAGYSSSKLDALRTWLKTLDTKALFVSVDGRVLLDYGDARYVSKIASARKSVLGMLYGKYVENGKIDLQ